MKIKETKSPELVLSQIKIGEFFINKGSLNLYLKLNLNKYLAFCNDQCNYQIAELESADFYDNGMETFYLVKVEEIKVSQII